MQNDMEKRMFMLQDYIYKKPNVTLKYTLKHSLIKNKLISTPTCLGLIRPSSGSCRA